MEGLNNKAKVTMRKSYGFRTYRVLELALYHSLGKLPEPESTISSDEPLFKASTESSTRRQSSANEMMSWPAAITTCCLPPIE